MYRFIQVALTLSSIILITTTHGFEMGNIPHESSLVSKTATATNLLDVGTSRRKGHYYDYYDLFPYYGWHALTWIYWIKVKLVVVAFFAYTAFIWALKYVQSYNNKCNDGGHHIYYSQGHYRSFDDVKLPQILQQIGKSRKRRQLGKRSNN